MAGEKTKTRLVPYEQLSDNAKDRMKAERDAKAKEYDAKAEDWKTYDALDKTVKNAQRLFGSKPAQASNRSVDFANKAKAERDWTPSPHALYGDDVEHEVDMNSKAFKKGGAVKKKAAPKAQTKRRDGIAQRGKTKGRFI